MTDAGIRLDVAAASKDLLEERMILAEDVRRVIAHAKPRATNWSIQRPAVFPPISGR